MGRPCGRHNATMKRRPKSLRIVREQRREKDVDGKDWRSRSLARDWKALSSRIDPEGVETLGRGSVKRYLRQVEAEKKSRKAFAERVRALGMEPSPEIPGEDEPPTYGRDVEQWLDKFGDAEPLAAFFMLIDRGVYPPPDVLLILLDAWGVYIESKGKKSLEECFFGPAVPHAGNYSERLSARLRKLAIAFEVTNRVEKQEIPIAKASRDVLSDHPHLDIDPETAAKYTREVQWPRLRPALERQKKTVRRNNKTPKNPR